MVVPHAPADRAAATASPAPTRQGAHVRAWRAAAAALGVLLVLHGLAHSGPALWGVFAETGSPAALRFREASVWLGAALWAVAMAGFATAGLGLLGVAPYLRAWRGITRVSAAASILLLLLFWPVAWAIAGLLLDILFVAAARSGRVRPLQRRHRRLRAAVDVFAAFFIAYLLTVPLLRPWYVRWGADETDIARVLPGDALEPDPTYRVDHVVRVDAPADAVWPWLAQIGQDRGGFYSYEWLENLFGLRIRNADTIEPSWQDREVGDFIPATPPGWLGGRFDGVAGWTVKELEPGRYMYLEGWGAFVIVPVDPAHSRLHVRTLGRGAPNVALAPFGVLVFEPMHWIMQRRMLLTIAAHAEAGGD